MDEKETILTPEGLRKLEEELDFLKSVKRKEVAERIKQSALVAEQVQAACVEMNGRIQRHEPKQEEQSNADKTTT